MVVLDGSKFIGRQKSFDYLNDKLDLDYHVTNLDSLYDCLTMISEDIKIINYKDIVINMGDYGRNMLEVFLKSSLNEDIDLTYGGYYV